MAKFFILHTVIKGNLLADFYVEFLESQLEVGDEFDTYFTYHKKTWKVTEKIQIEDKFILVSLSNSVSGLHYENEFAGALVNTNGLTKIDRYRYGDPREKELDNLQSEIFKQIQRIKAKRSNSM